MPVKASENQVCGSVKMACGPRFASCEHVSEEYGERYNLAVTNRLWRCQLTYRISKHEVTNEQYGSRTSSRVVQAWRRGTHNMLKSVFLWTFTNDRYEEATSDCLADGLNGSGGGSFDYAEPRSFALAAR